MNENYLQQIQANRLNQLEQMNNSFFPNPRVNQQRKSNVIYSLVKDFNEAQNFMLMNGEVGLLFNDQKSEFYKKRIDEMGMTSIKKYEYKEVPIPAPETAGIASNDNVLNKRIENIENALQILLNQTQGNKKQGKEQMLFEGEKDKK